MFSLYFGFEDNLSKRVLVSEKHSAADFGLCFCVANIGISIVLCCVVGENAGMSMRTADSVSSGLCCSYFELGPCLDL